MENLNFALKGKKFTTKDLKIGNIQDLWQLRMALSGGTYGQMYRTALKKSDEAMTIIDMTSFFTVFCPEVMESLKPGSIRELGLDDYLELREVFVKDIQPWLESVENLLKRKEDE